MSLVVTRIIDFFTLDLNIRSKLRSERKISSSLANATGTCVISTCLVLQDYNGIIKFIYLLSTHFVNKFTKYGFKECRKT